MSNLCQSGQCPYFNPAYNDPSGHGCTRFSSTPQCPAVNEFALDPRQSEYALYSETVDPAEFKDFMERWLAADKKYRSDVAFQQDFPGELPFPNRVIDHLCMKAGAN